jgi:sulfur carrier protein
MYVWINGERRELAAHASMTDALAVLGAPAGGVAIAVDGEVVPRAEWSTCELVDGARVEVLTAVQGG